MSQRASKGKDVPKPPNQAVKQSIQELAKGTGGGSVHERALAGAIAQTRTTFYFAAICLLIAGIVGGYQAMMNRETYPKITPTYTLKPIERVQWSPDKKVSAELIRGGVPKVLTNTFATKWNAVSKWKVNGEYLRTRIPGILPNVYSSKNPYFGPLFRHNKPLTKIPTIKWTNPHDVVTMRRDPFFAQVRASSV